MAKRTYLIKMLIAVINLNAVTPKQKEALEDILNILDAKEDTGLKNANGKAILIDDQCTAGFKVTPRYFEIVRNDYNKDLKREELQIHCGENGNLLLIKTSEGFMIDVNGQNDNVLTKVIWESDLNPEEENVPTDVEILEFKKAWGQTHSEVTANLGYSRKHSESDELLMAEYFWIEDDRKWYNKNAMLFTPREQQIADYLNNALLRLSESY